jgi:cytochrome c-type biogenesis protein CcmF
MTEALGRLGVIATFVSAVLGAGSLVVGLRAGRARALRIGRIYAWMCLGGAALAVAAMQHALITHNFSLKYVAENSDRGTPLLFRITGMWAALEGSILLWGFVLCCFTVAVVWRFRQRLDDALVAWATAVMLAVTAFFFALMVGPADPFITTLTTPADGRGANPLLQEHILMAIHPPFLYLGYVGATVPFAFAVAALVTGRLGEGWLLETRRWTLIAWGCLTFGIILGAWWSYEVLGWGGYWAWDPVENASLLPWLTGTAYIHSVLVQERRGMLRVWNLSLACATFALTILGTFLTRSGVVESVHAFSNSAIGPWLLSFFTVIVLVSVGLIGWRGDRLRSVGSIDSPVSREGSFLANNVLFGAFAFVVLLGTVFPLLVEAWNGDRLSVGEPYFDRMTRPIGIALLFMMAVAPALPWRKASGELLRTRLLWPTIAAAVTLVACVAGGIRGFWALLTFALGAFAGGAALRQLGLAMRAARRAGRSPLFGLVGRANGGMVVHIGVVLIAIAFAASRSFSHTTELRMTPGQTTEAFGHRIEYLGITRSEGESGRSTITARVRVDGGRIDAPALRRFSSAGSLIGTPSVRTGLTKDLYFTLIATPQDSDDGPAVIGFWVQPMILWLWVGGILCGVGTVLSIVPGRRRRATDPSTVPFADDDSRGVLVGSAAVSGGGS